MKRTHNTYTTGDYSLFVPHEYQQPMKERHVAELVESMRVHGFMESKPLTVVKSGGKFIVIDGHHRLAAAKILQLPIYFVMEKGECRTAIGVMNVTQKTWSILSFVKMYAAQGNTHYNMLLKYYERGIPLVQASSLLVGHSAHSRNSVRTLRREMFKVKTHGSANIVVGFIERFRDVAPAVKSAVFIEALALLLFLPEFDHDLLAKRIEANPRALVKCNNREQMLDLIEEIYNFRTREKVALAFPAKEAAKKRSVVSREP